MPLRVALLRPVLAVFVALLALPTARSAPRASDALTLRSGDRVVLLGDTLIEREQFSGWVELMLTSRFPAADVRFRNLGWSADTPAGASRTGLSLRQAGREGPDEGWDLLRGQLRDTAPSVVLVGYGMANSFDGADGLPRFLSDYRRLLDTLATDFPEALMLRHMAWIFSWCTTVSLCFTSRCNPGWTPRRVIGHDAPKRLSHP
jgi:hypothetical protein